MWWNSATRSAWSCSPRSAAAAGGFSPAAPRGSHSTRKPRSPRSAPLACPRCRRTSRRARERAGDAADLPGDAARYQTVFADPRPEAARSVAAPTAGLHLTPAVLDALAAAGVGRAAVTLEVGPGTFLPVKHDVLDDHPMHAERWHASAATLGALATNRRAGGRVLAVGTTSVRTLESLPSPLPDPPPAAGLSDDTNLFIRPDAGFTFRNTDLLLTNFHLPRSTLLALVAALPGVGLDRLLGWYAEAIAEGYRFYSFGDAMVVV